MKTSDTHLADAQEPHDSEELEYYGDPGIASLDAKVPTYFLIIYVVLIIWGFVTFYFFWNGSAGWLDRGYWHELQIAANTTFPIENQNMRLEPPPPAEQFPPTKQLQ